MECKIRPIRPGDNPELALIIRTALTEFGANKPGTVYYDESTDHLFELFQTPGSCYFVAEEGKQLLGVPDSLLRPDCQRAGVSW